MDCIEMQVDVTVGRREIVFSKTAPRKGARFASSREYFAGIALALCEPGQPRILRGSFPKEFLSRICLSRP
ncbi:hypothetical protein [Cupriavidus necator]